MATKKVIEVNQEEEKKEDNLMNPTELLAELREKEKI